MTSATLKGTLPKIGIRPVIDARQAGVRESLEVQTMNMARSVADLIGKELRHSNGMPIECVLPKGTIGRVSEAAECAELFAQKGVAVTITVTPCWCYSSEVIDMDPQTVKAVWGFNGTERPGAVFLAAALAAHSQKGLPAFSIYGHDVKDASDTSIPGDVREKLLRFTKAGLAATTIKGKSYLQIGSQCMGIAGSIVDHDFFQDFLGMRNESVDMTEIVRRVDEGIFDAEEFQKALAWTKKYCVANEGADSNVSAKQKSRAQKDSDWEYVVKMTLIMRDLMVGNPRLAELGFQEESLGHNAIAAGFQGQRQWTDHWPNGDYSEALLNSSFDWNGVREPFVLATENDTLNGVAMLLGHLLTDTASIFADVRTYWSPDAVERVTGQKLQGAAAHGVIHLINSGSASLDGSGQQIQNGKPAMKPFWDISNQEVQKCLKATTWFPANRDYFRGGGYSSKFVSKGGMPMTMVRVNLVKGLGPVLQLAEGWTCDLQDEVHRIIDERTDKGWPTTWFAPRLTGKGHFTDVYSVMANWGANHAAVCYGHCGADLITLASMLRIPVCTHNVEDDKIFRPAAWAAFGQDTEASDYRACATYGPVYK